MKVRGQPLGRIRRAEQLLLLFYHIDIRMEKARFWAIERAAKIENDRSKRIFSRSTQ